MLLEMMLGGGVYADAGTQGLIAARELMGFAAQSRSETHHLISPALRGRNSDNSGMQMINIRPISSASR